jgi:pimeloyl-ACP methyl ester carboxylesterase
MRSLLISCLAATLALVGLQPAAAAASAVGVVLLHGKTGTPNQFMKLSAALAAAGYAVAAPEMCWSKKRIFDKTFDDCMKEVDAAVASLKANGAAKVVVVGASQGAIAVFDYGATHAGLAGIVAMAPAGDPPDLGKAPNLAASIASAAALAKAGKGDTVTDFNDVITGDVPIPVKATPNAFLSFHGPRSAIATMKRAIADLLPRLKLPVLWISGTRDPTQGSAPQAFDRIPKNALNRHVMVDADHGGTADAAGEALTAWLATLK